MGHKGLPKSVPITTLRKSDLLKALVRVDKGTASTQRALKLETDFRVMIKTHVESLPTNESEFSKFNTNPFVLMIHCFNKHYQRINQIEADILPAKVFSSMETSAGRMVEAVVLPNYSWEIVPSSMHSSNSVLDGKQHRGDVLRLATLKSGARCLNDEMSENIADAIIANSTGWAKEANVKRIDFTYGVLYGTKKQSNKKDWHILRNIAEKLPKALTIAPDQRWACQYKKNGITVDVTIRIGLDLWNYIADHNLTFMELSVALIRACVTPVEIQPGNQIYAISDLGKIVSLDSTPSNFNVSIIQRSQLEWLFFFARHFCDELI